MKHLALASVLPLLFVTAVFCDEDTTPVENTVLEVLLRTAASQTAAGSYDEARQTLEQATASCTNDRERARVLVAEGDLTAQAASFRGEAEESLRAWSPPAEGFLILNNKADAVDAKPAPNFAKPSSIDPPGENKEAIVLYRSAIELARDDPITTSIAANNLAVLYIEATRWDAAIEVLETYEERVPEESKSRYLHNYGLALEGAGQDDKALAAQLRAVVAEPEFLPPYAAAQRVGQSELEPESTPFALSLVRYARENGYLEQATELMAAFLEQDSWFDLSLYQHALFDELLLVLVELDHREIEATWLPRLEALEHRLPLSVKLKISGIRQALAPSGQESLPFAGWYRTPEERQSFSQFLKQLGDRAMRAEHWDAALAHYQEAWAIAPQNLDAVAYLLNTLAIGPVDLDPEGRLARDALYGLQNLQFEASQAEIAGTLHLAGDALMRRQLTGAAIEAWQQAANFKSAPSAIAQDSTDSEYVWLSQTGDVRSFISDPISSSAGLIRRTSKPFQLLRPSSHKHILTLYFRNQTDDTALGWLSEQVAETLVEHITARENVRVVDPLSLEGRIKPDLILTGSLISAEIPQRSAFSRLLSSKEVATLSVSLQLLDAFTGQVLTSLVAQGSHESKQSQLARQEERLLFAATQAVQRAMPALVEQIRQTPWQAEVIRVSNEEILIDAGGSSGLHTDAELPVFREVAIDPLEWSGSFNATTSSGGAALGTLKTKLGLLKTQEVNTLTTSLRPPDDFEVRVGDIVRIEIPESPRLKIDGKGRTLVRTTKANRENRD